jgi:Protein of unknown function (DUF3445).
MSLGFSVENLLPSARVSGPLRMGLVKLSECEWLDPEPDLAARNRGFDAASDSVMVLPEAAEGVAELASLLGVEGGLEQCARSVWEDLCVMVQDGQGQPFRLGAAAVAFPTDWHLHEKIGKPVHQIHEPIDGYAENLSSGVDRFMDGLQSFHIFGRTNAFVVASDDLRYMPQSRPEERFAHVTAQNAGETLFVRCERETLRRLPRSRAIVFTIGIYRVPLGSLSEPGVKRIAQSVDGFQGGELERRAAPHYATALTGYAARRAQAMAA